MPLKKSFVYVCRDGANMSPQDSVVLASRPNWRAPASTQIKHWACLQRGALLFYLIGGICYIGESLLLSLKHVNTMCACRYEHALDWKNLCTTHTHTHTPAHTHKSFLPTSTKLHHTQWADVWKFPVQSWHQVVCCTTQGVCYQSFRGCWSDNTGND